MRDDGPEIVFNLWYLRDQEGINYSLRARAYVASGPEVDKTTFLKSLADVDYMIARPFPIPRRFWAEFPHQTAEQQLPVAHVAVLQVAESPIALWEDAIKALDAEIPGQADLPVPASPVVCITPLIADDTGNIRPFYTATQRF